MKTEKQIIAPKKLEVYANRFWWGGALLASGIAAFGEFVLSKTGKGPGVMPIFAAPTAFFVFLIAMAMAAMIGESLSSNMKIALGVTAPFLIILLFIF